jgi:hypothetical protein
MGDAKGRQQERAPQCTGHAPGDLAVIPPKLVSWRFIQLKDAVSTLLHCTAPIIGLSTGALLQSMCQQYQHNMLPAELQGCP